MRQNHGVHSSSVMLLVLKDGRPVKAVAVGERGVHIGRGRDADLSLVDDRISTDHARVWIERDEVMVRDLGSRNGTFVNEARIDAPTRLQDDDLIRLGPETTLRVRVLGSVDAPTSSLALVDLDAGVRTPLHVGDNEIGDLLIRVDNEGGVYLMGVPTRQLAVGEQFDVAGRAWLVRSAVPSQVTTEVEGAVPAVRVEVRLDGPTGPEARFVDLRQPARELRITAATQAEVVYVLAKKLADDRGAHLDEPGWLSNAELRQSVWGRQADRLHRSRLPVVLHRIRKALEAEGFSEGCIGRRRGGSRLWVQDVEVG